MSRSKAAALTRVELTRRKLDHWTAEADAALLEAVDEHRWSQAAIAGYLGVTRQAVHAAVRHARARRRARALE